MMTITEIAGFAGTGLAGVAYVPQISHLIRAHCAAGISRLAFAVWLLASVLVTVRAVAIGAGVFIVLGGIQIVATALIMFYSVRYKDMPCPSHLPRQPKASTAMGDGRLRKRAWFVASGRPLDCGISRTRRATVERCARPSRSCTAFLSGHRPAGREADAQAFRSWPKSRIAAAAPYADVAGRGRSRPCTGFQTTHLRGTR
jgi:uncharacterized protein with PQ loop repeat